MRTSPEPRCSLEGCAAGGRNVGYFLDRPHYACADHVDEVAAMIAREKRQATRAAIGRLGRQTGERFRACTLSSFPRDEHTAAALAAVGRWRAAFDDPDSDLGSQPNLYVHGPVGTGKTSLAVATVRALIENDEAIGWDLRFEFVSVRRLLREVKASFSTDKPPPEHNFDCELVVLDDLGAERTTEWARDYLAEVIERRYDACRSTIVTSNYAPRRLAKRLGYDDLTVGQRIVSRLIDEAIVTELGGPDRRKVRRPAHLHSLDGDELSA